MNTFTNPKNGQQIKSALSFAEAREAIKAIIADKTIKEESKAFPRTLSMLAKPSQAQEFWIYKLAEERVNSNKKEKIAGGDGFKKVAALFETAKKNGLNRRAIRLALENGEQVKLTPAPETGRNAGFIYIKLNSEYMGKVSPDGEFAPVTHCPQLLKDLIANFGNDTVTIARMYGKRTGNCCFCGRQLDTIESNTAGYGPICAEKYGLPWGEKGSLLMGMNEAVTIGNKLNKRDDSLTPRPDAREIYEGNDH